MHVPQLIDRKRRGGTLARGEIEALIDGFTAGEIPDYQMSALAMAVVFRGMSPVETADLTRAMLASGERLALPADRPPVVDKHSTGGVGDKISLVLAPLLACDGLWVPMISGRGLGITGGTLDKLESLPGLRTGLGADEAIGQLREVGAFIASQSAEICPADRRLYALRDVTATVASVPLIVGSILCKKLAESLDRLVLDVKFGSGAFMETRAEGEALAGALVATGRELGLSTEALLTPMDEPLGRAVGNAVEVLEAVEVLSGRGPAAVRDLSLDLATRVSSTPRAVHAGRLDDGSALDRFRALIACQGSAAAAPERLAESLAACPSREVPSPRAGRIGRVDARVIGEVALALGAGREKAEDGVDPWAGLDGLVQAGDRVEAGEPLARLHAGDPGRLIDELVARVVEACSWETAT